MSDPKAAAERIVNNKNECAGADIEDAVAVARAYLALLSGTDEERARAREVVTRWVYDDAECGPLIARIAAELAAARKRGYAQTLKEIAHGQHPEWEARALAAEAALAAVREECAQIAEECDTPFACPTSEEDSICDMMGKRIAAAIREGRKHG